MTEVPAVPTYTVLTPAGRIVAMSRVLDGVTPYLTGDVELWRDGEPVTLPAIDHADAPARSDAP